MHSAATSRLSTGLLLPLVIVAMVLAACGGGGEASTVPATASQTAPASNSSLPAVGAATLSWVIPVENTDGSVLLNLAGFKIYYGSSADALVNTISITNASISTYVVESLAAGTWYFGVSAVTSQGLESSLSNIASKTIS